MRTSSRRNSDEIDNERCLDLGWWGSRSYGYGNEDTERRNGGALCNRLCDGE